jgi:Asp-tRNA(Asn)/Glu-tRNA(Gln) amidotransferase A subunit family amidase
MLGLPSVAVCCGTSEEGLPIAVQVVGRPFHDRELIAVAAALEAQFGRWASPQTASITSRREPESDRSD